MDMLYLPPCNKMLGVCPIFRSLVNLNQADDTGYPAKSPPMLLQRKELQITERTLTSSLNLIKWYCR